MFHSGFGYGFGCFDDRIDRSGFAEKSAAAAQRREDAAKEAFNKIRAETEASATNDTVVVQLLKPSTHLTQPCWSAFSKHVRSFPGWTPKRRVATAEEKRQHGETRQAKCYFTDVSFNPKTFKKKSRATRPRPRASRPSRRPRRSPRSWSRRTRRRRRSPRRPPSRRPRPPDAEDEVEDGGRAQGHDARRCRRAGSWTWAHRRVGPHGPTRFTGASARLAASWRAAQRRPELSRSGSHCAPAKHAPLAVRLTSVSRASS